MKRNRYGFTLIEILVVISLLGMLMGLSIGFIARAGVGNLLTQTTNTIASHMASARASAFGNDSASVALMPMEVNNANVVRARVFRNRQVFHWPCEDLESASEFDVLDISGGVAIESGGLPSREGRNVLFEDGGRVSLGNPPWLQMVDGFRIRVRLRPDPEASSGTLRLFSKGPPFDIALMSAGNGGLDVRARIQLLPKSGTAEGGGRVELTTGMREGKRVPEWIGPVIPGRWQDVQVSYDGNAFTIQVNGSTRALSTGHNAPMKPDHTQEFVIGGGYAGGFDSLLISGIFEDDEDVFDLPEDVLWIDADEKPIKTPLVVHFLNQSLDPRHHSKPIELRFLFDRDNKPKRIVEVAMSGETFVRRWEER